MKIKTLSKLASILVPAALSFGLTTGVAFALTNPATMAPRDFNTQQTGYIRVHIKATGNGIIANGNTCIAAATNGANCNVKVGSIPANAFLVRQTQQIVTNFNSSTTDTLGFGTTTAGVNIKAAADVHAGAGAISSPAFASGGSGTLLTTGVAQTGLNGGYDIFALFTYTGGSIATAGEVVWVLEYFAPNDGDCVATAMGATPVAC